jgi:tRNA(Ser,Leu) C12 N-acetylase TAN1
MGATYAQRLIGRIEVNWDLDQMAQQITNIIESEKEKYF